MAVILQLDEVEANELKDILDFWIDGFDGAEEDVMKEPHWEGVEGASQMLAALEAVKKSESEARSIRCKLGDVLGV